MLDIYKSLFKSLHDSSISWCSWKNNHDKDKYLNGEGDLDIYVPNINKHNFLEVIRNLGFVRVQSYVADFPYIEHYYGSDKETGKLVHLHVYFKLITGESHIKQYLFPIDNWLIDNTVADENHFYQLSDNAQVSIHLLRHYIKISSFIGLLYILRDNKKYLDERESIGTVELSLVKFPSLLPQSIWVKMYENYYENKFTSQIVLSIKISIYLNVYLRGNYFTSIANRYFSLSYRFFNKLLFKRKKYFPSGGKFIAICGLDGSGKSTAVIGVKNWLARDFDVKVIHMGRPNPTILTLPFWSIIKLVQLFRHSSVKEKKVLNDFLPQNHTSLALSIRYVLLAYERLATAKRAMRLMQKGYIIVADRYPSLTVGKMDSPRITVAPNSNVLVTKLSRLEAHFYRAIPTADLVLQLKVPLEVSLDRNRMRDKVGKETDDEIRARYQINNNLQYSCYEFYKVDADQAADRVLLTVKNHIWNCIIKGSI